MENLLTPREVEVLQCFADDRSGKEAAAHLHMAVHTLFNYNDKIKMKLAKGSMPGCVAEGLRRGIIR